MACNNPFKSTGAVTNSIGFGSSTLFGFSLGILQQQMPVSLLPQNTVTQQRQTGVLPATVAVPGSAPVTMGNVPSPQTMPPQPTTAAPLNTQIRTQLQQLLQNGKITPQQMQSMLQQVQSNGNAMPIIPQTPTVAPVASNAQQPAMPTPQQMLSNGNATPMPVMSAMPASAAASSNVQQSAMPTPQQVQELQNMIQKMQKSSGAMAITTAPTATSVSSNLPQLQLTPPLKLQNYFDGEDLIIKELETSESNKIKKLGYTFPSIKFSSEDKSVIHSVNTTFTSDGKILVSIVNDNNGKELYNNLFVKTTGNTGWVPFNVAPGQKPIITPIDATPNDFNIGIWSAYYAMRSTIDQFKKMNANSVSLAQQSSNSSINSIINYSFNLQNSSNNSDSTQSSTCCSSANNPPCCEPEMYSV